MALLSACSGTKAEAPRISAVPVLAARVEQKSVPLQVKAIGAVEAYSNVSVKTQVTGELTGVHFKEGRLALRTTPHQLMAPRSGCN